jgi:hypothetical protein
MTIRNPSSQFPLACVECGKAEVRPTTIAYEAEVQYAGLPYTFVISDLHANRCAFCGDILFDHATHEQIYDALRDHLNLLSRQEIHDRLARFGLTQKELGEGIAAAPETISRWLSGGYVQSRAYDRLMRFFFKSLEVERTVPGLDEIAFTDGMLVPWSKPLSYHTSQSCFVLGAESSGTDQDGMALAV